MSNKQVIQKIVLGGAVIKDGKILILQRHENEEIYPGMWELPSGKRELLEPSDASLIREIKEETGIDVEIIMPFSVFDYQIEKEREIRDSTQINFLVKPISGADIKLSDEHQNYAWISKEETDKYNFTEATKNVIKKTFDIISLLEAK